MKVYVFYLLVLIVSVSQTASSTTVTIGAPSVLTSLLSTLGTLYYNATNVTIEITSFATEKLLKDRISNAIQEQDVALSGFIFRSQWLADFSFEKNYFLDITASVKGLCRYRIFRTQNIIFIPFIIMYIH